MREGIRPRDEEKVTRASPGTSMELQRERGSIGRDTGRRREKRKRGMGSQCTARNGPLLSF